MLVFGTFEHSVELEQALAALEEGGILRQHILVVPMDTEAPVGLEQLCSPVDRYSRGVEAGMAVATACSVVGTCVGFILAWGPILWGIAAGIIGFAAGFGLHRLFAGNRTKPAEKPPEVTFVVQCDEELSSWVTAAMWRYGALSVGLAAGPGGTES